MLDFSLKIAFILLEMFDPLERVSGLDEEFINCFSQAGYWLLSDDPMLNEKYSG